MMYSNSTPDYLNEMAKILLLNKPACAIYAIKTGNIIFHKDFEIHEFGKHDYKRKMSQAVIVSYYSTLNKRWEKIYFPSEHKLVNQVFRSLEKSKIKSKPASKILEINPDEIAF